MGYSVTAPILTTTKKWLRMQRLPQVYHEGSVDILNENSLKFCLVLMFSGRLLTSAKLPSRPGFNLNRSSMCLCHSIYNACYLANPNTFSWFIIHSYAIIILLNKFWVSGSGPHQDLPWRPHQVTSLITCYSVLSSLDIWTHYMLKQDHYSINWRPIYVLHQYLLQINFK